jgi:hypothetical protein
MLVFRPFFDLVLWSELHQRRRGMVWWIAKYCQFYTLLCIWRV